VEEVGPLHQALQLKSAIEQYLIAFAKLGLGELDLAQNHPRQANRQGQHPSAPSAEHWPFLG
jgi:hypothetical protein